MAIYKRDIASINLETGTIHRTFLNHSIGYKDQKADHFGIRVFRDGEPVDLTGISVQGVFMPPQGDPIAITSGNIVSGNEAEVVLPQACYNYDGQFCLAIKLVDSNNSVTGTMRIVDGMVDNTHASGTVAPTSAVPTYQEILSTYDAMVAATAAANGAIAATYSSSSTYKVGDYCIHDGALYRCTTAITTAEAWTAGHWTAAKIGPDVSDLKSALKGQYIGSSDTSIWSQGALNPSTGKTGSSTITIRTGYIASYNTAGVEPKAGYKFAIYAYDTTNDYEYVGCWNGNSFAKTSSTTWFTEFVSLMGLQHRDYYYKLAARNTGDTSIAVSDASNIILYKYTDTTLQLTGIPADAKTVGDNYFYSQGTTISSGNISTYPDCNTLPANHNYTILASAITAGFLNYAFSGTHIVLSIGSALQIAYPSSVLSDKQFAYRIKSSDVWQAWVYSSSVYDLYPTGDDTNRTSQITLLCGSGETCRLAPGVYYIDKIDLYGNIVGAGMYETRLIYKDFDSSADKFAIKMYRNSSISNLTLEKYQESGDITPHEDYLVGVNGLQITGTGSAEAENGACNIENVFIKNFEGCGIFARHTGTSVSNGTHIRNVRVELCSAGIYLGTYAEFYKVTDCCFLYNYTGAVVIGGNCVLDNCNLSYNENGLLMPGSDAYGTVQNEAHGIINACTIVHTGRYSTANAGYVMKITDQESTELISNCTFANGKIEVKDRQYGLLISGCDIKHDTDFIVDNCPIMIIGSLISGSGSSSSVLNGGKIYRRNCYNPAYTELPDVT